jgi:RNA polymerase II-associated protein 2
MVAAMATAKQPKSILKKTSYPATTSSTEDRDREVALYHANLIQQRKDIELNILLSTETLIDYPLAQSPYDASNPSPTDAREFKRLLRPFQPTDYDELIQERNINEKCGYTLCPNARVKDGGGGKYRLLGTNGKAKDFKVVKKEELEKWCSEACAKRALYVRVQLSESPAWEREAAGSTVNIDLLDEPKSADGVIVEGLENLNLRSGEDKKQDAADLALERGDKGLAAKNGLVDVKIQEKDVQRPAEAPSLDDLSGRLDTMHLTLEGHTSGFGSRRQRRHAEELEDEDDPDTDWMI